jgi:bacterial/archaeal transporter family-2 protein
MKIAMSFSFLLGFIIVLQGGLNRQMAANKGLAAGLMINNIVAFVLGIILYIGAKYYPQYIPSLFQFKNKQDPFQWWHLVPGVCGFLIISTAPWLISKIGASKTFITIVAGQLLMGLIWDSMVENIALNPSKIVAIILSLISVALFTLS